MYTTLDIEHHNAVATIWMNRPEVFNAFDESLINDLHAACAALDADNNVRVVVLAGRGKHFSAGADLNWMQRTAQSEEAENLADARRFAAMLYRLANMNKPTVARIQGGALGGGTGLAAACDIAIAADNASFATSEVRFGIIPAVISPYVLRAIGARHALRLFQTGERFRAEQALAMGLVSASVPLSSLDDAVSEVTTQLLAGAPRAQRAAKALINAVTGRPLDEHICEETARRIARQRAGEEAWEGIGAFLAKRDPAWMSTP